MSDRPSLAVTATLTQPMGEIGHYEVTAVFTVTCASLGEAVMAVAETLGDLPS